MVVFEDGLARKSRIPALRDPRRRRPERRRLDARGDHPALQAAARRAGPGRAQDAPRAAPADSMLRRLSRTTPGAPPRRPGDRPPAEVRLRARAGRRRRRSAAGGGGPAGAGRARHQRHPRVRAGQAARGGVAARRGGPGDHGPHERGPLPAPADPRRGPPVRDHPPPQPALEVDGREHPRRRPGPGRGAPQDAAQALRLAQEAPRGRGRPDRARPRHRARARRPPSRTRSRRPTRPARLLPRHRRSTPPPARSWRTGHVPHGGADPRRAGDRHRHDRRRPQHGRQGARGPRLLRGRQPPADAGARRRTPRRRQPGHPPADRGGGRRPLRLVLRLAPGQPAPARHRPPDDAALPRGDRGGAGAPAGGGPASPPAPGRRPAAPRPPARARRDGRHPGRRRRPARHVELQRPPAPGPHRASSSAPPRRRGSRSR